MEMDLENLINDVKGNKLESLEPALLLMSGINAEECIDYQKKLDSIVDDFKKWAKTNKRKYGLIKTKEKTENQS